MFAFLMLEVEVAGFRVSACLGKCLRGSTTRFLIETLYAFRGLHGCWHQVERSSRKTTAFRTLTAASGRVGECVPYNIHICIYHSPSMHSPLPLKHQQETQETANPNPKAAARV